MMSPIKSVYDVRLLTILSITMDVIEQLTLLTDTNSDTILAEALYRSNKQIHEIGEQPIANKLMSSYPILTEALD